MNLERSLHEILQILSISLFEKASMYQVLTEASIQNEIYGLSNQLVLLDL